MRELHFWLSVNTKSTRDSVGTVSVTIRTSLPSRLMPLSDADSSIFIRP